MKILLWHVHGSWTDAFVHGSHEYLLPALPEGGAWGLGRADRDWPTSVRDIHPDALADEDIDVVVLQRPEELAEAERLLGRRPGRDIPAVYVEHNTPRGDVPNTVHPLADQTEIPIAHVTHFNELLWDNGTAPTVVVEHGIRDPGHRYTGELGNLAVVTNEPVRRWRVTGTDLLPGFAQAGPVDVFGMGTDGLHDATGLTPDQLRVHGDLKRDELHREMARRRVYLHPIRWTSLGLALLEAMHLGMPVVALATTEAIRAIPPETGVISTQVTELHEAAARLLADPAEARAKGTAAREHVLAHYGLDRFLRDWDALLDQVADAPATTPVSVPAGRRL
ncbi:glycosyltransferase [Corynebacterium halotolerans]|uniref:Transferase n=1 Tax=Corynebacterium halotolerans YIM 70093 = DSM 44683 TaxID=1121362 RepID=M1MWJ6_9CORY|nr:glycosyltransferase [Corynebacterium halotolerans]AGF72109.1 transferase [Corynebacterium halotolerans YIM 70093 = DSM 44683]